MKKQFKLLIKLILSLVIFFPFFAHAQLFFSISFGSRCAGILGLSFLLCKASTLLNSTLPVLVALGVVYFVWGVVQYFIGDSDEAKEKGRDRIIYGIIGLVVIVGLWGLVVMVLDSFGAPDQFSAPTFADLNKLLPR